MLTAAIVASMALVSCNKEEVSPVDSQPKSVTVKLPNIMPTKATGDAIDNGSQVALTDYTVFFTDAAGNVVEVPAYNGQPQTVYFSPATGIGTEYTYHFLPASTENVVVVGNLGDVSATYTTEAQLAAVVEKVLNDEGTAEVTLYPLYGKSGLTKAEGLDEADHTPVYTATVNLTPRVSRFEVYAFGYNTEEGQAESSLYESVALNKIALNNYYTEYNFVSATPAGDPVYTEITDANAWTWMETVSAPWADDLTVSLNAGQHLLSNGNAIEPGQEGGEGTEGIVTYGIVSNVGGQLPELVLTLTGTKAGVETPLYLVGNFPETTFEAGKIYRVDFVFDDEDLEQPERCVELTVTVAQWEVVPVTPEF